MFCGMVEVFGRTSGSGPPIVRSTSLFAEDTISCVIRADTEALHVRPSRAMGDAHSMTFSMSLSATKRLLWKAYARGHDGGSMFVRCRSADCAPWSKECTHLVDPLLDDEVTFTVIILGNSRPDSLFSQRFRVTCTLTCAFKCPFLSAAIPISSTTPCPFDPTGVHPRPGIIPEGDPPLSHHVVLTQAKVYS